MSQAAAIRNRKRQANGYAHVAKRGRPKYPGPVSADKARIRQERLVLKQQVMRMRKAKI